MDQSQFKNVSEEAKNLIAKLLVYEKNRMSAEDLLQEEWMNKDIQHKNLSIDYTTLLQFSKTEKLKKVALTYVACQMNSEEIQNLSALFKSLDVNSDGTLSFEEIQAGLAKNPNFQHTNLREITQAMDTDNSGSIDYTEFIAASIKKGTYMQKEQLYQTFNMLDSDGSGKISFLELKKMLNNKQSGSQIIEDDVYLEMIQKHDKNGDGEIDYEEFVEMMEQQES